MSTALAKKEIERSTILNDSQLGIEGSFDLDCTGIVKDLTPLNSKGRGYKSLEVSGVIEVEDQLIDFNESSISYNRSLEAQTKLQSAMNLGREIRIKGHYFPGRKHLFLHYVSLKN